jgi:DNA-binding LacI/PurR family transcriptional regulator
MNDSEYMRSSVRRMIERRVEGVAIMTFGMEDVLLADFKSRDVPLVFVDIVPPAQREHHPHRLSKWDTAGNPAPGRFAPSKNSLH